MRGRPKRIASSVWKKALSMYREGCPGDKIVKECKLTSIASLYSYLRRKDLKPRKVYKPRRDGFNKETENKIVSLYKDGHTMAKIAETLSVHVNTVGKYLKKHRARPCDRNKVNHNDAMRSLAAVLSVSPSDECGETVIEIKKGDAVMCLKAHRVELVDVIKGFIGG